MVGEKGGGGLEYMSLNYYKAELVLIKTELEFNIVPIILLCQFAYRNKSKM